MSYFYLIKVLFIVFLCFSITEAFIKVYLEDIYFEHIDTEYFDPETVEAYIDVDEGHTANVNITQIKDLPEDCQVSIKILAKSLGEFTQDTGIEWELPLCDAVEEPIIGGGVFKALEVKDCDFKKRRYELKSFKPSHDGFPDYFIRNKYLVILKMQHDDDLILEIYVYIEVQ